VQEHDLDGGALLIVVGRVHGAREAEREQQNRRRRQPGQHAVNQRQEARRVGEIDNSHRQPFNQTRRHGQWRPAAKHARLRARSV
jgi:hypothetical protein